MSRTLGIVLILLGLLLIVGLVTIVHAAVGEAVVPPGERPDARRTRRARLGAFTAAVLVAVTLTGGRSWWAAEADAYAAGLHEPIAIETATWLDDGGAVLQIALVDPRWLGRQWTPLVPDHGKLMHAFLVREPDRDVFAHVHPEPVGTDTFRLALPPLPAGRYTLYADIVHESGFAQTLTRTVEVPATVTAATAGSGSTRAATDALAEGRPPRTAAPAADPDDAWWQGSGETARATLADGSTVEWQRPARVIAGEPIDLAFEVRGPDGGAPVLQPYMGMMAHAAVRRDDGSVFVHLHPTGSISMAAQQLLAERHLGGAAIATDPHAQHAADSAANTTAHGDHSDDTHARHMADGTHAAHMAARAGPETITIPYAFPTAGSYRVWLQFKRAGVVQTAAFDVVVEERS